MGLGGLASVASAVGGSFMDIGGSLISGLAEKNWAEQMATRDYERYLDSSDPAFQMARLKNAGLNPNLVYGTGSVHGGSYSSHTSAPSLDFGGKTDAIDNMYNYRQRALNIEQTRLQNDNVKSQTAINNATVARVNAETRRVDMDASRLARENRVMGTGTASEVSERDSPWLRAAGRLWRSVTGGIKNSVNSKWKEFQSSPYYQEKLAK